LTLPVGPKLVKFPRYAWLVWLASALTASGCLIYVSQTNGTAKTQAAYGRVLAENLATLSVEPFVAQDRIALGMLSNHVGDLHEVAEVTIVDINEQILASTNPTPRLVSVERYTSAPVQLENNVVGYVRVRLNPDAFVQVPTWRHWLFAMLLSLCVPVGIMWIQHLWQHPQRRDRLVSVDLSIASVPEPTQTYLLAANLFNRMGLDPQQQMAAQQQAYRWAKEIAELYGGQALLLDQAAVVMRFSNHDQDDAAFEALCAGLLWRHCLADEATQRYRLGGHIQHHNEATNALAQTEALLLAAVAGSSSMAVSARLLEAINRPERVSTTPANHPLHEDLSTVGAGLYQLQGLAPEYESLLAQQAATLRQSQSNAIAAKQP